MADDFYRQQMHSLLKSGQFSDVILLVSSPEHGHKEFKVHRNLLSTFSPVFEAMFSHPDTKEALEKRVIIEDVSPEAMHRLLIYIYTGELKFDENDNEKFLLDFLVVIDKYQINQLKDECESQLIKKITVDSVCTILKIADLLNASDLKEKCLSFIVDKSAQVISRDEDSVWQQFEKAARLELTKDIFYRLAYKNNNLKCQNCHSFSNRCFNCCSLIFS